MSGIGAVGAGRPLEPVPAPEGEGADMPAPASTAATRGPLGAAASTAAASVRELWARLSRASPEGAPLGANLDASGARRPVSFEANGRFSAEPGTPAQSPAAVAAGLYAAATLIDDTRTNLFDATGFSEAQRRALFATLREDLQSVQPQLSPPAGLDERAALQMRSAGATVLLELMTAAHSPEDLKREAFALYREMLEREPNRMLKDSMAFHLERLRQGLPRDLRPEASRLAEVLAPKAPPYEAWFKDGNDTIRVDWAAQDHAEEINLKVLREAGFQITSQSGGETVLEKTITRNGVATRFEVHMRPFRSDMYDHVGEDGYQIHVYTGHSNWGRNMRESLDRVRDPGHGGQHKLVLTELCVGKGEMQMFYDKFPHADLVTTYNSSYFYPGRDSEGPRAFLAMIEGIAARRGYAEMAEEVRRTNPFRWTHERSGIDNNFIFPTDIQTRKRVLDEDHDGQADVFDRLVDFDLTRVPEESRRDFTPQLAPRPADALVGTKVHFAAQTVNRLALYSEIFEPHNTTGKVLPGGWYEPEPGETRLFRWETTEVEGQPSIVMRANARYAHMSEEALRMAACYEYALHVAATDRSVGLTDPVDARLAGLVLASHSLYTDVGWRDREVWREFLRAYNLPEIDRSLVERYKEVDSHYYSGSRETLRRLRAELPAEVIAQLGAPVTGQPG
ncbi:MAG: hypothetical protein KatS3mg102_1667 [Planctomycetota bacterium]|nr:MAG: hypothetical protein KatS3mg102_1667 [Planctomycetota bacterium]